MDVLEDEYAIGLDLGTTFSCIGVYRKGGVEIIPNSYGEKTTPSVVIFTKESNILVGEKTTDFWVKNMIVVSMKLKDSLEGNLWMKNFKKK